MPILDMSLEELKQYTGVSPCPADFDAYWEKALSEMRAVDPVVELRPAAFRSPNVSCFDLYFTGVRGARVHANFVRPEKTTVQTHPGVILFHGYTAEAPGFLTLLPYAYAGFYAVSLDVRGQGGKSQDTSSLHGPTVYGHIVNGPHAPDPQELFFRDVFLDCAELARILMNMPEVDENRVACMGGSQGGGLTVACAALEPRIAMLMPQYPWLSDYKRVWDMDQDQNAYQGLRDYFRHFDPTHAREGEIFGKLGYIDVHNLAPRIRGRVLMGTGLMDNICPPSTQFAVYNSISAPKEMVVYPDFGHEWLPGFDDRAFQLLLELL